MDELKYIGSNDVMNKSQTNFIFSSMLLPKEKRADLNTIYAFCRKTDDLVDEENYSGEEKKAKLDKWKNELIKSFESESDYKLLIELRTVKEKYNISETLFFDLIKGMQLDLVKNRYKSFEELYQYCYYVASTVGLMTINLFGYSNNKSIDFAINLGIALQLTNILRDIKTDAVAGRIYLPLDDIIKFGYSEEKLMANVYDDNFKSLMIFEVKRAKEYYNLALKYLPEEDKKNMIPALIMEKTYYKILKKLEKKKYNIFKYNISVSKIYKIYLAFFVILKYRVFK